MSLPRAHQRRVSLKSRPTDFPPRADLRAAAPLAKPPPSPEFNAFSVPAVKGFQVEPRLGEGERLRRLCLNPPAGHRLQLRAEWAGGVGRGGRAGGNFQHYFLLPAPSFTLFCAFSPTPPFFFLLLPLFFPPFIAFASPSTP